MLYVSVKSSRHISTMTQWTDIVFICIGTYLEGHPAESIPIIKHVQFICHTVQSFPGWWWKTYKISFRKFPALHNNPWKVQLQELYICAAIPARQAFHAQAVDHISLSTTWPNLIDLTGWLRFSSTIKEFAFFLQSWVYILTLLFCGHKSGNLYIDLFLQVTCVQPRKMAELICFSCYGSMQGLHTAYNMKVSYYFHMI